MLGAQKVVPLSSITSRALYARIGRRWPALSTVAVELIGGGRYASGQLCLPLRVCLHRFQAAATAVIGAKVPKRAQSRHLGQALAQWVRRRCRGRGNPWYPDEWSPESAVLLHGDLAPERRGRPSARGENGLVDFLEPHPHLGHSRRQLGRQVVVLCTRQYTSVARPQLPTPGDDYGCEFLGWLRTARRRSNRWGRPIDCTSSRSSSPLWWPPRPSRSCLRSGTAARSRSLHRSLRWLRARWSTRRAA